MFDSVDRNRSDDAYENGDEKYLDTDPDAEADARVKLAPRVISINTTFCCFTPEALWSDEYMGYENMEPTGKLRKLLGGILLFASSIT